MAQTIWLLFAFCLLDMALAQPPPPPPPNQNQTTPRPSPMVMGRPQQNSGVQQQPAPMLTIQSQNQNNDQNGENAGGNASSSQMVQFQQGNNNGCPPIFGQNFPRQQQTLATNSQNQCQWVIISDRNGCPTFFQNCGSNPPMCNQQNEIWWQCTSQCEPSCGNPTPNCRQNCGRSGCQCFPGFLRNQNGFCVNSNQCPSADQCDTDDDCDGDSMICRSGQCQQGCTSNNACQRIQQCRSGRCVDRGDCQRDNQCRDPKICIFNQCRFINSLFCRSHFDCPGSSFCGRNGRCQFSFRSFDQIPLGKVGTEKGFF